MTSTCPFCNSESVGIFKIPRHPHAIFKVVEPIPRLDFSIERCSTCGFIFQGSAYRDPNYDAAITSLYQAYISKDETLTPFPEKIDRYLPALDFIEREMNVKRLKSVVEVGCGRGDFLYYLQLRHPHLLIQGIDPTIYPQDQVPVIHQPFSPELLPEPVDLVVLRHVLEHLRNPSQSLAAFRQCLKPDGWLLLEVPNTPDNLRQRIEVFTPDHVSYFSPQTLAAHCRKAGFFVHAILDNPGLPLCVICRPQKEFNDVPENQLADVSDTELEQYLQDVGQTLELVKAQLPKKLAFFGAGNLARWFISRLSKFGSEPRLKEEGLVAAVWDDSTTKQGSGFTV